MARYLLKRLLLLLPTLWVITSLVFVFNKMVGGDKLPFRIGGEILHNGTGTSPEILYKHYLHQTGQDLPLFYFSLKTLAEPDTLYRVFPLRDRNLLKTWVLQYGNWVEINAYFQHLTALRKSIEPIANAQSRQQLQRMNERLFRIDHLDQAHSILKEMQATCAAAGLSKTAELVSRTRQCALQVVEQATGYKNLVPVIHWYGANNQYHQWFSKVLKGDFGNSNRDSRPVVAIVGEAIGNTLWLTVLSIVLVFSLAILIGVFLAHQDHHRWRNPLLGLLYTLDTLPIFITAFLILIALTESGLLNHLSVYGSEYANEDMSFVEAAFSQLRQLSIPATCLTLATTPYIAGQVYQAIREEEMKDYVRTARAKGQKEYVVIGRHALRNSLLPIITLLSGFLPALIGGALVVEVIFSIPGMGRLLTDSVLAKDYPVVMGIVICLALVKIIALILADALYFLADPRIRFNS